MTMCTFYFLGNGRQYKATSRETSTLKKFFEENFHYHNVDIVEIPSRESMAAINAVLDIVEAICVAQKTALIVGYFGHGRSVGSEEYRITPASFPYSRSSEWPPIPTINWTQIQKRLHALKIDVLVLLDSCHAAAVAAFEVK